MRSPTPSASSPTRCVDIATLTGAIVIALGHVATGLFANDQKLADEVRAAADDGLGPRLADAAVGGLPGAAALELRRHGEHRRPPRRQRSPPRASWRASRASCAGRTSTSPAPPGRAAATRARPGGPCRCWSRFALRPRRPKTVTTHRFLLQCGGPAAGRLPPRRQGAEAEPARADLRARRRHREPHRPHAVDLAGDRLRAALRRARPARRRDAGADRLRRGDARPDCEVLLNLGAECPPHFERFARLLEDRCRGRGRQGAGPRAASASTANAATRSRNHDLAQSA